MDWINIQKDHSELLTVSSITTNSSDVAFVLTLCQLKIKTWLLSYYWAICSAGVKKELQTKFS